MFGLFKSTPPPYVEKRGFLTHKRSETLDEAVIRIYNNGSIVIRKGEYTHYEAKPKEGSTTRFVVLGPEPYYNEFFIVE